MKKLRIHCFQHVSFEGLGCIADWIQQNDHSATFTKFYKNDPLPTISDIDWLIVMGGPMGVHDEDRFSWLKKEKEFIKQAINAGKTVLGICLGAQLIAAILRARVYKNTEKEIGWFDIAITTTGKKNKLLEGFADHFKVFHWHGDTFDLPVNAEHLLQTTICKNQAFLYKEKVLGLQFHLEVTKETLTQMAAHGRNELTPGNFIQSEAEILDQGDLLIKINNKKMFDILDRLAE
ncbi:MAG TPA: type 1 glutamine amidotransferase [Ferruginibacter sp.]|nr:type 1 glutamine amidotransferase [Ferruginibacter sp.]